MHTIIALAIMIALQAISTPAHGTRVFSDLQVCKAEIAAMMSRDPRIIKVVSEEDKVFHLYYIRPNDRSRWDFKCTLDGARIMWGNKDGRWRYDPRDEVLSYQITGTRITIQESALGNTRILKSYDVKQIPAK